MTKLKQATINYYKLLVLIIVTFLASCAPDNQEVTPDYAGSWTCTETTSSPAATTTFTVTLSKVGTSETAYKIGNFYNLGPSIECAATFTASSATIAQQNIGPNSSSYAVSGSGSIGLSTKINLNYKVDDGSGTIDNCTATLIKK